MERPPAKFKTSINSLPLIHRQVTQLVQTYRQLQRKIKSQNQINLTNRLQEYHRKIRHRISQLDEMYVQYVQDPRVRFLESLKLELCKAISPKEELNQIADESSVYSGGPLTNQTMNLRSPILVKDSKLSTSRQNQSPTHSSITPTKSVRNDAKSKTPPAKPKVPALNVKSITKPPNHLRSNGHQSDLQLKMRKFSEIEQPKHHPTSTQRTPTKRNEIARPVLRKEISERFDRQSDKRVGLDSLQQLRLTIKMTKDEYHRFVKQVEAEGLDF